WPSWSYVNSRDTAYRILHDNVEHAFAVAHTLLRDASEIDCAEHGTVFRIDHRRVFRQVTEHVDPLIEGMEVDAVRAGCAHIDLLGQGQRFGVEHRDLGIIAGEAMAGLRIDGGTIPCDAGNLAGGLQRVEIEYR